MKQKSFSILFLVSFILTFSLLMLQWHGGDELSLIDNLFQAILWLLLTFIPMGLMIYHPRGNEYLRWNSSMKSLLFFMIFFVFLHPILPRIFSIAFGNYIRVNQFLNLSYIWNIPLMAAMLGLVFLVSRKAPILFFSANPAAPDSKSFLEVEREMRAVKNSLKSSRKFQVMLEPATDLHSMMTALGKVRPYIVHFSGHGTSKGLVLLSQDGQGLNLVKTSELDKIFKPVSKDVKCMVLNACNSSAQAEVLSRYGFYVIGSNKKVNDSGSINFAEAFYDQLEIGADFQEAFRKACTAIADEGNYRELWFNGERIAQ